MTGENVVIYIVPEGPPTRWLNQTDAMVYAGFGRKSRAAFLSWAEQHNLSVKPTGKPIYDKYEIDAARQSELVKIGGVGKK